MPPINQLVKCKGDRTSGLSTKLGVHDIVGENGIFCVLAHCWIYVCSHIFYRPIGLIDHMVKITRVAFTSHNTHLYRVNVGVQFYSCLTPSLEGDSNTNQTCRQASIQAKRYHDSQVSMQTKRWPTNRDSQVGIATAKKVMDIRVFFFSATCPLQIVVLATAL